MKLFVISIVLFCALFVLAIPIKMANTEFADLLQHEKKLEDSVNVLRYRLALEQRVIDSLSSRERIEKEGKKMELEMRVPATKIKRGTK